jgi:hypothetical protein
VHQGRRFFSKDLTMRTLLTSTAIAKDEAGNYSQNLVGALFTHEAIRRELKRGISALEYIDMSKQGDKHLWKLVNFIEWYREYLYPVLIDHEHTENEIVGPIFNEAGIFFDDRITKDHPCLVTSLKELKTFCDDIMKIIHSKMTFNSFAILINTLKSMFNKLAAEIVEHVAFEESIFPNITASCPMGKIFSLISVSLFPAVNSVGCRGFDENGRIIRKTCCFSSTSHSRFCLFSCSFHGLCYRWYC